MGTHTCRVPGQKQGDCSVRSQNCLIVGYFPRLERTLFVKTEFGKPFTYSEK